MSRNNFLDDYIKAVPEQKGIKGIELNKAYVARNNLHDVGLELEIEGHNLPTAGYVTPIVAPSGASWSTHQDQSLRGEALEYVLSTPCKIEETEGLLQGLWDQFRRNETRFNLSNRCSTHVHVNMGGKKINELTSIIGLWTTFEEPLINWCGEERTTNHFCLSSKDSRNLIENWEWVLKGRGWNYGDGSKYSALNVRPIRDLGSIEFRTMRASETYEPILDWTKFIFHMTKFASTKYENPMMLAADLSERGSEAIFADICKQAGTSPEFIVEVIRQENFDGMCLEGFRRAQPIMMGFPWHNWLPLINEPYVPSPFGKKSSKSSLDDFGDRVDWGMAEAATPRRTAPARIRIGPIEDGSVGEEIIALRDHGIPPNPNTRVDPERAIEFADGTPALVVTVDTNNDRIKVFAERAIREIPGWTHADDYHDARRVFWYSLANGKYIGRDNAYIRNVNQAFGDEVVVEFPDPQPAAPEAPPINRVGVRDALARAIERANPDRFNDDF